MASVSLNSIHHHQPAPSTGRPIKGRSAAPNRGASTLSSKHNDSVALAPNTPPSARLEDYDLIECVDLTTSLPMKAVDPFGEPVLGFGGTENAQGNFHCPWCRWALNDDFQTLSRLGPVSWPPTGKTTALSYPSRSCCAVPEKYSSHNMRYQLLEMELGGLRAPLNIPARTTAITLPLSERNGSKTSLGRSTATAASTSAATARNLRSRAGSRVASAL
ncbi:hypothetical protein OEA41_009530 [Lepraria neglecta]|uniref:Uncharacterized protein n=1 Tax=Lepraria neglecta TaxID=209136 RepID=A0AAD9Z1U3_9LECA|nr:hypothetical protein OEA41_009530 [Lepraria neglecta]